MPVRVMPAESLDEEEYRDWSGEEDEDRPSDDPAHPHDVSLAFHAHNPPVCRIDL